MHPYRTSWTVDKHTHRQEKLSAPTRGRIEKNLFRPLWKNSTEKKWHSNTCPYPKPMKIWVQRCSGIEKLFCREVANSSYGHATGCRHNSPRNRICGYPFPSTSPH